MASDPLAGARPSTPTPPPRPYAAPVPAGQAAATAIPLGWTAGASRLLAMLFAIVALEALYTVPKLTWELAAGGREGIGIILGLAAAGLAALLLWISRRRLAAGCQGLGARLAVLP